MDGTTKKAPQCMFNCFFIVRWHGGVFKREWTYPYDGCSDKEFKQYENFCFPVSQTGKVVELRNQHFTYMLTDIDVSRKYGFCKMIDTGNGKLCYCFISELPWFEIFYKCLNCVCTVHVRNDTNTLHTIIEKLYGLPVPRPNEIVSLSTSLTFSVPDYSALPSIPETRNMMEYVSTISTKNMVDIYAAYMFERRIIFTSANLSVLSGCVFASESLLQPLSWQHIFIPLLHEHIIDYCAAPMPFIVGMHSSLYKKIEGTASTEGVVTVNIDENIVTSPYDDVHKLPNEAISYLRSQLGKPNISVGANLAQAFLKTQALLFGCYRVALKFRMGETILFDEEKFVSSFKPGGKRSFAEELVHMQAFQQFIDKRLHMLNNGVGFHDPFEEAAILQQEYDYSSVYTEWIARKRSEIYHQAKANMKQARSSAKQSMRDMKIALKSTPKEKESYVKELSLSEDITTVRPPRPPRPPLPSKFPKPLRRYTVIDSGSSDLTIKSPSPMSESRNSGSSPCNEGLLIDFSTDTSPPSNQSAGANGIMSHLNVPSANSSRTIPKKDSSNEACCHEKLLTGRCSHMVSTFQQGSNTSNLSPANNSVLNSLTDQSKEQTLISFD